MFSFALPTIGENLLYAVAPSVVSSCLSGMMGNATHSAVTTLEHDVFQHIDKRLQKINKTAIRSALGISSSVITGHVLSMVHNRNLFLLKEAKIAELISSFQTTAMLGGVGVVLYKGFKHFTKGLSLKDSFSRTPVSTQKRL